MMSWFTRVLRRGRGVFRGPGQTAKTGGKNVWLINMVLGTQNAINLSILCES